MGPHGAGMAGPIIAHAARKVLLAGVGALMDTQGASMVGAVAAHAARKGLLPNVDALVNAQVPLRLSLCPLLNLGQHDDSLRPAVIWPPC